MAGLFLGFESTVRDQVMIGLGMPTMPSWLKPNFHDGQHLPGVFLMLAEIEEHLLVVVDDPSATDLLQLELAVVTE